jgi:hypothetical protein
MTVPDSEFEEALRSGRWRADYEEATRHAVLPKQVRDKMSVDSGQDARYAVVHQELFRLSEAS